jgi:hypothetical protein
MQIGRLRGVLILGAVVALGATTLAQRFGFMAYEPSVDNPRYDGRFALARIRYTTGPGGYYYQGLPAWAHGYPNAEHNLMQILTAISGVRAHIDEPVVARLDEEEITKYPVSYMTEAGYWVMNDAEAAGMRNYLRKGGFVIFDDFRPPPRGGGGWENFADNMERVLPGVRFFDLDPSHPIFHSFFDINSFDILPQYYDQGRPEFKAIFENNDPAGRMLCVINYNTDISNFWEFANTGLTPVSESNEAYEFAVNYIIYGLTH